MNRAFVRARSSAILCSTAPKTLLGAVVGPGTNRVNMVDQCSSGVGIEAHVASRGIDEVGVRNCEEGREQVLRALILIVQCRHELGVVAAYQ